MRFVCVCNGAQKGIEKKLDLIVPKPLNSVTDGRLNLSNPNTSIRCIVCGVWTTLLLPISLFVFVRQIYTCKYTGHMTANGMCLCVVFCSNTNHVFQELIYICFMFYSPLINFNYHYCIHSYSKDIKTKGFHFLFSFANACLV